MFVSFVVCCDDDDDALIPFVRDIDEMLAATFDRHEIVVVDNRPRRNPGVEFSSLQDELRGTIVHLELARHHESEHAMLAGLARAIGDFVYETETPHRDWDVDLLREMFERCASGVDVVDASNGDPSWSRRQFFDVLNRFSYLEIPDHPVTVRMVSRRALNAMLDMRERVRYRRALYAATGYPHAVITYTPTKVLPRRVRRRAEHISRGFDVMVSFSDFGLRLANIAALIFAGFAAFALLYTVAIFVFKRDVVTGWTTIMLLLSIGLAGLFIVLSLIGEYIARILIEVRHRPPFTVRAATVYPSHSHGERLDLTPLVPEADDERFPGADLASPPGS
ncbi:MAG: hypothetical protein N2037_03095 [Acidimicrobiales bacterium]|nr:hypothetical protein [Acidimicrobiales bacterium]